MEKNKQGETTQTRNGEKGSVRIEKDLSYLSYVAYKENQSHF